MIDTLSAFVGYLREFNIATTIIRLLLAAVFGGLIGIERGRRGRAAGLRTHMLVCMGAAITTLTGLYAYYRLGISLDPLRMGAQVISGIGFLGVGTILVTGKSHVKGLTTAAGLWTTAAIGLAVGIGYYEAAVICVLLSGLAITQLSKFESSRNKKNKILEIFFEIRDANALNETLGIINDTLLVNNTQALSNIEVYSSKSGIPDSVGVMATITLDSSDDKEDIVTLISACEGVIYAVENH